MEDNAVNTDDLVEALLDSIKQGQHVQLKGNGVWVELYQDTNNADNFYSFLRQSRQPRLYKGEANMKRYILNLFKQGYSIA